MVIEGGQKSVCFLQNWDIKQGQIIFTELSKYNQNLRYVALSPRGKQQGVRNERWKLIINVQIEVDEI